MIKNLGQVAAIYVGKTAPRNVNMIWLDNTVIPYVFKSYNGEEWTGIPTGAWVETYVNGWLVSLQQGTVTTDDDYLLINSGGVNYKMTVRDFVKSSVGNPLDFKGVIRTDSDFPNPSTVEGGDMYIIITNPTGGTVTDPYSGKTFSDSEKIVWDSVINSWASLGKIDVKVDLSTTYSATEVTIHSSAGKETTVVGVTDDNAGVMVTVQKKWLDALSDGSTLTPQGPSTSPYHKHRYADIVDRIISQQVTGDSAINPMSQKATTEALNLKLDKSSILQVSGVSTTDVMSQKAVTDAISAVVSGIDLSKYALLAGNNTFSGSNTFALNKFQVGTGSLFRVNADANLIVDSIVTGGWNKELAYYSREASSSTAVKRGAFGIKADGATEPLDTDHLYLSVGKADWRSAQYKFRANKLIVPNTWSLRTISDFNLIKVDGVNEVRFGSSSIPNYLTSNNTDITHRKYTAASTYTDYKIWDESNLPSPVQTSDLVDYVVKSDLDAYATKSWVGEQNYLTTASLDGYAKTTDLASYLPLAGGTLTGDLVLSNNNYIRGILSTGTSIQILGLNSSNTISVGNGSYNLLLYTGASDISHWKGGTSYKIWDASNVSKPLNYVNGIAGSVTSVYTRNLNLNETSYPFIGTGTSVVTLFAPTTAGTSGQVLQSQGAGKAPIWVDGGTGGGVQLSDTNVWTGLNTFQGGLKTSDGTNSYDVWDKNNLKYVARITPSNLGYALSFYTTTAGWRDFDDLCINNLMPNASKTIEQGGAGFVGQYESAYASAEIKDIVTQNIFASGGKNLSNVSTGASFLGNESNAFKSAYIGEINTNTVKSADSKSLLNFKTDGVYMIANSGTEYKLATLNDISGGGSSVSLDGNNTWTGVNIFSGTTLVINQYDSGNTEIPSSAKYSIRLACGGSYNEYGFGAIRTEDRTKQSYSFVQTPSAFFTFDNSGSLYTTIGSTKYEFWNKQNLAKPITYNTNTEGDAVLYKGDSASKIDRLVLLGTMPDDSTPNILQGGTGGFGSAEHAYASCHIGAVYTNEIHTYIDNDMTATVNLTMDDSGVYFAKSDGTLYKLTMEVV